MNRLLLVLAVATATYANPLNERIIGGTDAEDGEFPYQVSLQRYGEHTCGGSILNEYWILTAAHCLYGIFGAMTVVTGINNLSSEGTKYEVDDATYHDDFVPENLKNDIALVKVSEPIVMNDKVQPIKLHTKSVPEGAELDLSGWGLTDLPNEVRPDALQKLKLKAITNDQCKKAGMAVFASQLCTYEDVGKGACQGDSGGPLAYKGRLAGIVSYGEPCAKGYPDIFTRVSEFIGWINEHMY